MCLAFATYLGALTLSSAFVAPDRSQSLHWVAWLAMSMLAGVLAFVLIRSQPASSVQPLAFGGFVIGATGILIAAIFLVSGPVSSFGVQDAFGALPRVFGLAWEANLYASFLAICAFFALEAARGRRAAAGLVMLAAVLIGFPLGITRAAYAGLVAGAVVYAGVRLVLEKRPRDLLRPAAISGALLAVGIAASIVLLPNVVQRHYVPPPAAGSGSGGGAAVGTPGPLPSFGPQQDTMGYRLERVNIAAGQLPKSPVIGFGAVSFGQENPGRYNGPGPDYIAVMSVAVIYDSGVVGATALAIGFALLLASLWIAAHRFAAQHQTRGVGLAAAFMASIICMLVAYQSTNAIEFAINWMIVGAACALVASSTSVAPLRDLAAPAGPQEAQKTKLET
jgi:hypothetical protein